MLLMITASKAVDLPASLHNQGLARADDNVSDTVQSDIVPERRSATHTSTRASGLVSVNSAARFKHLQRAALRRHRSCKGLADDALLKLRNM